MPRSRWRRSTTPARPGARAGRDMNPLPAILKVLDPFAVALTGLVSYFLRFDDLELPPNYQAGIWGAFGLSVVTFAAFDVYRGRADEGLRSSVVNLLGGWFGVIV